MRFLRSLRSVEIRGRRAKQKTYKLLLIGLSFYYLFLGFSIAAWAAASFAIGTLYGEHDT